MRYLLSAQPIDAGMQIGFQDGRNPLETIAATRRECFLQMAQLIEDVEPTLDAEAEFGDADPCWDLSLSVIE